MKHILVTALVFAASAQLFDERKFCSRWTVRSWSARYGSCAACQYKL